MTLILVFKKPLYCKLQFLLIFYYILLGIGPGFIAAVFR